MIVPPDSQDKIGLIALFLWSLLDSRVQLCLPVELSLCFDPGPQFGNLPFYLVAGLQPLAAAVPQTISVRCKPLKRLKLTSKLYNINQIPSAKAHKSLKASWTEPALSEAE